MDYRTNGNFKKAFDRFLQLKGLREYYYDNFRKSEGFREEDGSPLDEDEFFLVEEARRWISAAFLWSISPPTDVNEDDNVWGRASTDWEDVVDDITYTPSEFLSSFTRSIFFYELDKNTVVI